MQTVLRLTACSRAWLHAVVPVRTKHVLADEGSYFVATNPTLGTGVGYGVLAALADTSAAFVFYNNSPVNETLAKRIYLDRIKLATTVAPASSTGWSYAIKLDNGAIRQPTAGQAAITPNPAMGSGPLSTVAKLWAFTGGAVMTVPASSANAVNAARGGGGGLPVVGTELSIQFGGDGSAQSSANAGFSIAPPLIIQPGWYAVFYLWFPSNASTGLSAEYEIGWWER